MLTSYFRSLVRGDWVSWFILIFLAFFVLWLLVGGGDYEYVGLAPMKIDVDSTKYIDDHMYKVIERGNYHANKVSGIDVTPKIPATVSRSDGSNIIKDNSSTDNINFVPRNHENKTGKPITLTPIPEIPPVCEVDNPAKRNSKRCSKGEAACREALEQIYGKPFDCVRPDFLKNPETGKNLELDCYNDELKIGLEYNGIQHYKWPNFTGQSKEDFVKQLRRDKYKTEVCTQHGIYLINVPYNVPIKHIKSYIEYYRPENYENRLADEKDPKRIYDNVSESYDADMINYESSDESYDSDEMDLNDELDWDSEDYDTEYEVSFISS